VVRIKFHTERTKFKLLQRSSSITYTTKNGLFKILEQQQAFLERQIEDCLNKNMAEKTTQKEKDLFLEEFLEFETLEETFDGYRRLYQLKINSLENRT